MKSFHIQVHGANTSTTHLHVVVLFTHSEQCSLESAVAACTAQSTAWASSLSASNYREGGGQGTKVKVHRNRPTLEKGSSVLSELSCADAANLGNV